MPDSLAAALVPGGEPMWLDVSKVQMKGQAWGITCQACGDAMSSHTSLRASTMKRRSAP